MGLDHGHAGADVVALDQRRVPDPDAGHVRDRVLIAGRQRADGDTEVACA
jgi:hypothetical protein